MRSLQLAIKLQKIIGANSWHVCDLHGYILMGHIFHMFLHVCMWRKLQSHALNTTARSLPFNDVIPSPEILSLATGWRGQVGQIIHLTIEDSNSDWTETNAGKGHAIGCGWGGLCKFLAEKHEVSSVGVTVSEEGAKIAREKCANLQK